MKVMITGAGGQLGRDLQRILSVKHCCFALTRQELDVTDGAGVKSIVKDIGPDVIIHAAAYTAVDQAEADIEEAYRINAIGTGNVALAAASQGAVMVHISTDYVFDGSKQGAYDERDYTMPRTIYGQSKLLGEQLVQTILPKAFIVRTSWLYGKSGINFVKKMLELASRKTELAVVSDQTGSPTYTLDLAAKISELIETKHYGLYHISNRGCCTRAVFAAAILEMAGLQDVRILPISSKQFPQAAARPANSALADLALVRSGFSPMRHWKDALQHFIAEELSLGRGVQ